MVEKDPRFVVDEDHQHSGSSGHWLVVPLVSVLLINNPHVRRSVTERLIHPADWDQYLRYATHIRTKDWRPPLVSLAVAKLQQSADGLTPRQLGLFVLFVCGYAGSPLLDPEAGHRSKRAFADSPATWRRRVGHSVSSTDVIAWRNAGLVELSTAERPPTDSNSAVVQPHDLELGIELGQEEGHEHELERELGPEKEHDHEAERPENRPERPSSVYVVSEIVRENKAIDEEDDLIQKEETCKMQGRCPECSIRACFAQYLGKCKFLDLEARKSFAKGRGFGHELIDEHRVRMGKEPWQWS
jgi:hypothetical protein